MKFLPERATGYSRVHCQVGTWLKPGVSDPGQTRWCISIYPFLRYILAPLRLSCFWDVEAATVPGGRCCPERLFCPCFGHRCDCSLFCEIEIFYIPHHAHTAKSMLRKYVVQWILVCSQTGATIPTNYKASHPQTLKLLAVISHSPQQLATTNLLFASMDLPVLNISGNGNHTIWGPWCLAYFT